MSADLQVLQAAHARIEELLALMRKELHGDNRMREQLPLMEELAQQYDLVGSHYAAANIRRQADALIPLRNLEDRREEKAAEQAARRRRWTLGLWS